MKVLSHKLELYIPTSRMPAIRPYLPDCYTEAHVIGHYKGEIEPVVIVTIWHDGSNALDRAVVCYLLELGEHSALTVEDDTAYLWTEQEHEVRL